MRKVNKKIIISIALFCLTIISLANTSMAVNPDDPKWNPNPSVSQGGTFISRAGTVLGWIKYIGIIVSVVALAVIGLKYMLSSVEGKAEYKKTMGPYIVGCFMLAGVSIVIAIIEEIAK